MLPPRPSDHYRTAERRRGWLFIPFFVCLVAAALNAVFAKLGQKAGPSWNISGDPCTGTATDDTNIDNSVVFKAAIKCEFCTGGNTSICRITRL